MKLFYEAILLGAQMPVVLVESRRTDNDGEDLMHLAGEIWGTCGPRVVCIHGSLGTGPGAFMAQKPLADDYQLYVPYRRGYGPNPRIPRVDVHADAKDVITLLGKGAHLIGTSMGGVVSMLAAGKRPDLVHSLTVIEPPAFPIARDLPAVKAVADALRLYFSTATTRDPLQFAKGFLAALEMNMALPDVDPDLQRAMENVMTEVPWNMDVPVGALADAPFPKLIVTGGWSGAFDGIGERLAGLLGARYEIITGAGHGVQRRGEIFNPLVRQFLAAAGR